MHPSVRQRFAAAVAPGRGDIDLVEAALLVAAEDLGESDVDGMIDKAGERLTTLAESADAAVAPADGGERIAGLVRFLSRNCGFRGNQENYYDLDNSYLNVVLERRVGIPITLAIVYMEIGRCLGLEICGVGFPGHFLAAWNGPPRLLIDPFHGSLLDEDDCAERLRAVTGPQARFDPALLAAVTHRQIIVRVLANLKLIHFRAQRFAEALACSERILLVEPDLPSELRDRAVLYLNLECYAAACADLERYLAVAGDHAEADAVRAQLARLRVDGPKLH